MHTRWIVALAAFTLPSAVRADSLLGDIAYIDGSGEHSVGTTSTVSYSVARGNLAIGPGSRARAVSLQGVADDAASAALTGGQVDLGIDVNRGTFAASGGTATGYDAFYGGDALRVFRGSATIDGGTFVGGNATTAQGQAGSGVVGSAGTWDGAPEAASLLIRGGTFQGGSGAGGYYGGTTGYSLLSLGNATITGGHFLSPIAINTAYGGTTDFLGSGLSFRDHMLTGVLLNGDLINVRIDPDGGTPYVDPSGREVRFGNGGGGLADAGPPDVAPPLATPEPSSALAFAAILAALAWSRRRGLRPA